MALAMQGWRREASRTLHRQCHDSIKIISHIEFYHLFSPQRAKRCCAKRRWLAFTLIGGLQEMFLINWSEFMNISTIGTRLV